MRFRFKAWLRYYDETPDAGDDVNWESMGIEPPKQEKGFVDKLSYIEIDPFTDVARTNPTMDGNRTAVFMKNGERIIIEHSHESYCSLLGIPNFEDYEKHKPKRLNSNTNIS